MPTYKLCDEVDGSVANLIDTLILFVSEHTPLQTHGVRINLLFAYADLDTRGNPTGPAVMAQGYPAHALVRLTSYKDRVKGLGDCEMIIDHAFWEEQPVEVRKALLDHELTHIQVVFDEYDRPQKDKAGRPKLKLRKHDFQVGWFDSVAKRNGVFSIESQQATTFFVQRGQLYLPGFDQALLDSLITRVGLKAQDEMATSNPAPAPQPVPV